MNVLYRILDYLTALFTEYEPEHDEYEGYDKETNMED
jgi:hypothetical protein